MDTLASDFLLLNAYFTRPRSKRDVNIANTVLVHLKNIWYLGYLQDVEEESILINFNCKSFSVARIHKDQVFPHPLVTSTWPPTTSTPVYIAVRLEQNGPYIFVTGRHLSSFEYGVYVCHVEIDLPSGDSVKAIVHRQQMVLQFPAATLSSWQPVACEKHVVHYGMSVFREGINEIGLFRRYEDAERDFLADWERVKGICPLQFYLAVTDDTAIFIWWNVNPRIRSTPWRRYFNADNLKEFFALYALPVSVSLLREVKESLSTPLYVDLAIEELEIGALTMDMLVEVFRWLDVHTQTNIKRVCASWLTVLVAFAPVLREFLTIDLRHFNLQSDLHCCTESYRLALLLDYALQPCTKIIQFVHFDNFTHNYGTGIENLEFVILLCQQLCSMKSVSLCALCIANVTVTYEFMWSCTKGEASDELDLRNIWLLLPLAHFVVIRDYTLKGHLRTLAAHYVSHLPVNEELENARSAPRLSITISQLVLRRTDNRTESLRKFLNALEKHCPEITAVCRVKLKKLLDFWLQVIPYPSGWNSFRDMLKMLDHRYYRNGRMDSWVWDNVDLRDVDADNVRKLVAYVLESWFF